MTKSEIRMLEALIGYEIFRLEGIINAIDSKESKKNLRDLKLISEILQKPDIKISKSLNNNQKEILSSLIQQARLKTRRVLIDQEKIKEIQKNSNILNSLEKHIFFLGAANVPHY